MNISTLMRPVGLLAARLRAWMGGLRLATKIAAGASVLVVGGMAHLSAIVAGHVRDNAIQQSAAAAALYMDSFVERHVQELATSQALSTENRHALERLLSPASAHRPIVAFRIWKGDTIVFSNERELVGKTFAPTHARDRAWQGHIAVEFEQPDGDDDEQVRALQLPILEVYAPMRERGTGRIMALVETYEVAVELKREVFVGQLKVRVAIAAVALTVVLLLFSMASTGGIERNSLLGRIAELSRLRAESEERRQRVSHANLHVSAMNERSLRRVGNELRDGPAQCVALALLKFDSLDQLAARAQSMCPDEDKQDLEIIRKALDDALRHIRRVASNVLPADIEELSVAEVLARAARFHEGMTGVAVTFETRELPEQLPFPVKACLYRFALESLHATATASTAQAQGLFASCDRDRMVLEIVGADRAINAEPRLPGASSSHHRSLRDRIEAVGGKVSFEGTPAGLSLIAEFNIADMELADA